MPQENPGFFSRNAPLIISSLAMIGTLINAFVAANSFNINREAYQLNRENLKTTVFLQLQQHYSSAADNLPERIMQIDFTPEPGSADYKKVTDYWLVCYAEWYQTNKASNGAFSSLWTNYYAGLIKNALIRFPAARRVLQDLIQSYGANNPDVQEFYQTMRMLAQQGGKPLAPNPTSD